MQVGFHLPLSIYAYKEKEKTGVDRWVDRQASLLDDPVDPFEQVEVALAVLRASVLGDGLAINFGCFQIYVMIVGWYFERKKGKIK